MYPDGAILIFSAHGVSQAIRNEVNRRNLTMLLDATCPLVTKVHMKVARASFKGKEVILIGHMGHPEVEGTIGQYNNKSGGIYLVESLEDILRLKVKNENNLCFMTQTTLSIDNTTHIIDALNSKFPKIIGPRKNDICYATINRQKAVRKLSNNADIILVVGSKNSSNSNRLVELVRSIGKVGYLIDSADDIKKYWLENMKIIGLTAGASAPDILVSQVIKRLITFGATEVIDLIGHKENIVFKIPKELQLK